MAASKRPAFRQASARFEITEGEALSSSYARPRKIVQGFAIASDKDKEFAPPVERLRIVRLGSKSPFQLPIYVHKAAGRNEQREHAESLSVLGIECQSATRRRTRDIRHLRAVFYSPLNERRRRNEPLRSRQAGPALSEIWSKTNGRIQFGSRAVHIAPAQLIAAFQIVLVCRRSYMLRFPENARREKRPGRAGSKNPPAQHHLLAGIESP